MMDKLIKKFEDYIEENHENGIWKSSIETIEKSWICNECGFSDYNLSISESDINSGNLQCSNCGCNEFHLKN